MRYVIHCLLIVSLSLAVAAATGCEVTIDEPDAQQSPSPAGGARSGSQSALGQTREAAQRTMDRAAERDQQLQEQMQDMFEN